MGDDMWYLSLEVEDEGFHVLHDVLVGLATGEAVAEGVRAPGGPLVGHLLHHFLHAHAAAHARVDHLQAARSFDACRQWSTQPRLVISFIAKK